MQRAGRVRRTNADSHMRSERKYLILLALVFAGAVAAQVLVPEPIDWSPGFSRYETRPYGSRVVFEVLDDLLPHAEVRSVDVPPYLWLADTTRPGRSYVFVTDAFEPDPAESAALLDFARRGNTLFVAAETIAGPLADTLGVATGRLPYGATNAADSLDRVELVNPALRRAAPYTFVAGTAGHVFTRFDTTATTVLGTTEGRVSYVRIAWGAGAVLLSTVPYAFTNYNMVTGENAAYVAGAFSYLPEGDVWWDEHHKPGRRRAGTPLRFVLSEPALRLAYGLGIGTLLLFIVFRARRRQRVIPVVAPPRNTTLAFIETVGRLSYQRRDHRSVAEERITYFLAHLRETLNVPTNELGESFIRTVAARSGVPVGQAQALVAEIASVRGKERLSEEELLRLSQAIDRFRIVSVAAGRRSSSPPSRSRANASPP